MDELELDIVSLLGPSNHPNGIKTPTRAGACVSQYSPAPHTHHWPPATGQSTACIYNNYPAPVGICACDPCHGIGKWLLRMVLSNSDSTHIRKVDLHLWLTPPVSLQLHTSIPFEMMLGSNNQKSNHIITFQETLYGKQSYKLKKRSRGKIEKLSPGAWIF